MSAVVLDLGPLTHGTVDSQGSVVTKSILGRYQEPPKGATEQDFSESYRVRVPSNA